MEQNNIILYNYIILHNLFSTCRFKMDTTWKKEKKPTNGHLENGGTVNEAGCEDLE